MDTRAETIDLTIPPDPRLLRLVRLVASSLGTITGLDVDELDDLRIAVDEGVSALLEGGDGSLLRLRFDIADRQVAMSASSPLGRHDLFDARRVELSKQILATLCDEQAFAVVDSELHVRVCRRAGVR